MKKSGLKFPSQSCPPARWAALTLLMFAILGAAATHAAESPVTARLDLLSPPAPGGEARVIWAAIPNAAPRRAELTLAIEPPGGARPRRITRALSLTPGQLCEQEFSFRADAPGPWRLRALLKMTLAGQVLTHQSDLTLSVPRPRAAKPLGADDPITTVAVGGAAADAKVPYGGAAWLRFDAVTTGSYRIDLTTQTQAWNMVVDLYGPNRMDQSVNQFWLGLNLDRKQISVALRPGAYYIKLWCLDKTASDFKVGVSYLGLRDGTPVIQKFAINDGATSTTQRRLALNNVCSTTPAELWVSPYPSFEQGKEYEDTDLELRQWFRYSRKPYFAGRGNGVERLYFRVRTADGFYSQAASDEIEIVTVDRLPENAPLLTGVIEHAGEWDWWRFSAASERYFQIVTDDYNKIQLYGPDSMTRLAGGPMNSQRYGYSSLIAKLKPGTYYARVEMAGSDPGRYQIRLIKSMGAIVADLVLKSSRGDQPFLDGLTFERTILLNSIVLGDVAQYKLTTKRQKGGRLPDFTGSRWKSYVPEIKLTLPAGSSDKSIFFKVRNYKGRESPVVRAGVALRESAPLPLGEKRQGQVALRHVDKKGHSFEVTREGDYFIELWNGSAAAKVETLFYLSLYGPDAKLIKEESLLFKRSDPSAKRIGVKLKPGVYYLWPGVDYLDNSGLWHGGKYSIRVSRYEGAPLVLDFHLSNAYPNADPRTYYNLPESYRRKVTMNCFAFGSPTAIMASESPTFEGAVWKPYAAASTFRISSSGQGVKTVYLKIRDAKNRVSKAVSARIFFNDPWLLALNGAFQTYTHHYTFNYHKFTVTRRGAYTVDLQPGSGQPGEDSPRLMKANLLTFDGKWVADLKCYGQTQVELNPGIYLVQTDKADKDEDGEWHDVGNYDIRVSENP